MPGWHEDISHLRRLEELPSAARAYLERLSGLIGRPISFVSVGPERQQTIFSRPDSLVGAA
jgi:adenylosuccinate synthase